MADITMCNGEGCKQKDKCYRHTAKPCELRQSYFAEPPKTSPTECEYYWDRK